jgi:hypothetical protein
MAAKKKTTSGTVAKTSNGFLVVRGELQAGRGRPSKVEQLLKVVGEKLPFEVLQKVQKDLEKTVGKGNGVYIAHDSMGTPRYIGRGNIFGRLKSIYRKHSLELLYFSFYVVIDKKHEHELETILIHTAGPLLEFNERKRRTDIEHAKVGDFEAGTIFYERQQKRGKKSSRNTSLRELPEKSTDLNL